MPDGHVIDEKDTAIPTPKELHEQLKDLARQALDRTLAELPEGETNVERFRKKFADHAHERLAQTPIHLWLTVAEERGEAIGRAQAMTGFRVAADALAQARRTSAVTLVPRAATERHPMEQLVRYVNGAAEQFTLALSNAQVAVMGRVSRDELPALEPRTRAVYSAVALGRAAGALLVALFHANGSDALLGRTLREAVHDGVTAELGPVLDRVIARTN